MSLSRFYKRTTRLPVLLPEGDIEIPAPQPAPTPPGSNWLVILLPVAGTVIGFGAMIALSGSSSSPITSLAVSIPMMLISYVTAIIQYTSQKKKYESDVKTRTERYETYLTGIKNTLLSDQQAMQAALAQVDPSPQECIHRVEQLDAHLWERTPAHVDFLSVRLGLGTSILPKKIKLPKPDPTQAADPLINSALALQGLIEVDQCPVLFPLKTAGIGGITGPRQKVLAQVRSLAMQLATHHSPDEVNIIAIFPESEYDQWAWLRWLPHVSPAESNLRLLACTKDNAHRLLAGLYELLQTRKLMLAQKEKQQAETVTLPALVFFLADPGLLANEPIFKMLRTEGPTLGAYPIFLDEQTDDLPQGCGAIAELGTVAARLILTTGKKPVSYTPDLPSLEQAEKFAQSIASIRLESSIGSTEIPNKVALLDVLGVTRVEEIDLDQLWSEDRSKPQDTLSVAVGRKVGGELFYLDLHEPKGKPTPHQGHGPHGLVAGTTGSGKGEFLQSLVASLAVHYHPGDVSFVILDFGLGATASPLEPLPHVINTISNQELEYVPRALKSLNAEFERRQVLFDEVNQRLKTDVQHIDDYIKLYRQKKVTERLPYLVLIVDEFAVLRNQLPDELNNFVKVAVLGRKYGFRMILCTQKPAGIISDQIQSNAKFRVCLKAEKPEDSTEMIKRTDAIFISRAGRAYFDLGSGQDEIFEGFQSAYAAAPYTPGIVTSSDPNEIFEIQLDGSRRSFRATPSASQQNQVAQKQIQAVVTHIRQMCDQRGIHRSKPVWLPPLSDRITLEDVRPDAGWSTTGWQHVGTWLEPVVGLLDDPAKQVQRPLRLNLAREGHMGIFGASGAGKTLLLQTIVTSLALDHTPEELHFYVLDFGSRSLNVLNNLPHVGEVIGPNDAEKLVSLMRFIQREAEKRKKLFDENGVNSLSGYRAKDHKDLPAIVVILDNYPNFKKNYQDLDDLLVKIAQEEVGKLGIHLVITANTLGQVTYQLANLINLKLALQLPINESYTDVVGKTGGMKPVPVPGRGLVAGPLEFQSALPAAGSQEADRNQALKQLFQQLEASWQGAKAPPIPRVPKEITLSGLLPHDSQRLLNPGRYPFVVPLGYDVNDKVPLEVGLYPGQHFMLTGPVTCGKHNLLQAWLLGLAESTSSEWLQIYLADFCEDQILLDLCELPHVRHYLTSDAALEQSLIQIEKELSARKEQKKVDRKKSGGNFDNTLFLREYPAIVLAISDFTNLKNRIQPGTSIRLANLVSAYRDLGFHVLVVVPPSEFNFISDDFLKALAEQPYGFILGESNSTLATGFKYNFAMGESGKILPEDEGYYIERGSGRKVKIVDPWKGTMTLLQWVQLIKAREPIKAKTDESNHPDPSEGKPVADQGAGDLSSSS